MKILFDFLVETTFLHFFSYQHISDSKIQHGDMPKWAEYNKILYMFYILVLELSWPKQVPINAFKCVDLKK